MTLNVGFTEAVAPEGSTLRVLKGLSRYGTTKDRRVFSRAMSVRFQGPGEVNQGRWKLHNGHDLRDGMGGIGLVLVNDDKASVSTTVNELWNATWGTDSASADQEPEPQEATMKTFYVLWNPACPMPPKVRFSTLDAAKGAAEQMATRHPGETFHVMENRGAVVKSDLFWDIPGDPPPF